MTEKEKEIEPKRKKRSYDNLSKEPESELLMRRKSKNSKSAFLVNNNFNECEIICHYLGKMDITCQFCGAKHFKQELAADKKFSNCCHKGKVILNDNENYPEYLHKLIINDCKKSKNFMNHVRSYNSALAFASFGAKNI